MPREISIPEMKALYEPGRGRTPLILVAGGRSPEPRWLHELCANKEVWAIDRGVDACFYSGILPSLFIGDGDSASRHAKKWLTDNKVPLFLFPPEKDLTDLQLALKKMAAREPFLNNAVLTGAFGGRFDHMFANLFSLLWAEEELNASVRCMADDREAFFLVQGGEKVSFCGLAKGTLVSTLSLSDKCTGITTTGTRWPVSKGTLYLKMPYAVSNAVEGTGDGAGVFTVEVESGWLGVYIHYCNKV